MDAMDRSEIQLRAETTDRSMLVLQYAIAVASFVAALLLPSLH